MSFTVWCRRLALQAWRASLGDEKSCMTPLDAQCALGFSSMYSPPLSVKRLMHLLQVVVSSSLVVLSMSNGA
jgi:hypothetical protein